MTMTKNRYNPYEFDKSNANIQDKKTQLYKVKESSTLVHYHNVLELRYMVQADRSIAADK